MKVKRKSDNEIFDAFRCGIDSRPDWFCDHVTDNSVITFHNSDFVMYVIAANKFRTIPMPCFKGDYIINTKLGLIRANPDAFRKLYDVVEEDEDKKEPVNTININDLFSYQKEKERADRLECELKKLTEHFNSEFKGINDLNNKQFEVNKKLIFENTELEQRLTRCNKVWRESTGCFYPKSVELMIKKLKDKCSKYEDELKELRVIIGLHNFHDQTTKIKELESRLKKEIELRESNFELYINIRNAFEDLQGQYREQKTFNEHIVAENEEFCQKLETISRVIHNDKIGE